MSASSFPSANEAEAAVAQTAVRLASRLCRVSCCRQTVRHWHVNQHFWITLHQDQVTFGLQAMLFRRDHIFSSRTSGSKTATLTDLSHNCSGQCTCPFSTWLASYTQALIWNNLCLYCAACQALLASVLQQGLPNQPLSMVAATDFALLRCDLMALWLQCHMHNSQFAHTVLLHEMYASHRMLSRDCIC